MTAAPSFWWILSSRACPCPLPADQKNAIPYFTSEKGFVLGFAHLYTFVIIRIVDSQDE